MLLLLSQYTPPTSAPVISGLNGTGQLYDGQACTITGLQFTGTGRTITLRQGTLTQSQTELTGSDTELTFTADTEIFAYGPLVLEVENENGVDQVNVTLVPVAGKGWIAADVPWSIGTYSVFEDAAPAVADGDQLEYELVTDNGGVVTMFADGTFAIDDDTQGHEFAVRVFDQTDHTWSDPVTITVNFVPTITIVDPIDGDGTVIRGQVGAYILGSNFGTTQGTVTIGGVAQTVQTWADGQITFIVNPATPLGTHPIVVVTSEGSRTVSVIVAAAPGQTPVFLGPAIGVSTLTQNTALSPLNVAARFIDPVGQTLVYSAVGTWPAGVIVTAVSGVIQGLPTVAGTYNGLAVRATDTDGLHVDSNTFTIVVNPVTAEQQEPPPPAPTPPPAGGAGSSGVNDVLIANLALTKLGEARIISFGDDTKSSRAVLAVYDVLRDAELRRRKWRFSLKRAQLPALAVAPEFGYAYAYQLPHDCLSILSVGDIAPGVDLSDYRTGLDTELYSVEGRTILTDLPAPLKLRYKARITDPTQFDVAFVQAFASRLAYELAEELTQSASKKQQAAEDYRQTLREAVAANAIEVAPTPIPDDAWLLSRI